MKPTNGRIAVIGLDPEELRWVRTLVSLLRHPDPSVPELARQALLYLAGAAQDRKPGNSAGDVSHYPDVNLVC